jgi:F-type H+-transporting ATPase subunit delta
MAVAQRMYARALFEAAQEEGRLGPVAADLGALADAVEQMPELRAFLRNPEVEPAGKSAVLEEITAGADDLVRNFVRLLAEKGRTGEIVQIREELDALVARAQNRLTLELQTAHELSDDEAKQIVDTIEEASGRSVEATRSVDPDLIGGVVLQVGSFRVDGSVRGRLERLRHELATTA